MALQELPPLFLRLAAAIGAEGFSLMPRLILKFVVAKAVAAPEKFGLLNFAVASKRGLQLVANVVEQFAKGEPFSQASFMAVLNKSVFEPRFAPVREHLQQLLGHSGLSFMENERPPHFLTAGRALLLRLPVYAETILLAMRLPSGSVRGDFRLTVPLSPEASDKLDVALRLLHRFSLARNPELLSVLKSKDLSEDLDASVGGDGGSTDESSGAKRSSSASLAAKRKSRIMAIHKLDDLKKEKEAAARRAKLPQTEADADRLLSAQHHALIDKLNAGLEAKSMFFTRAFLTAVMRSNKFTLKRCFKICSKYHAFYVREVKAPRLLISDVEKMVMDGEKKARGFSHSFLC
jgi:hypothetical protein